MNNAKHVRLLVSDRSYSECKFVDINSSTHNTCDGTTHQGEHKSGNRTYLCKHIR